MQPEREGYTAESGGVVAESLERSYPWAIGSSFGVTELCLELWAVISGISGLDDWGTFHIKKVLNRLSQKGRSRLPHRQSQPSKTAIMAQNRWPPSICLKLV